jgi:hypothetical protein
VTGNPPGDADPDPPDPAKFTVTDPAAGHTGAAVDHDGNGRPPAVFGRNTDVGTDDSPDPGPVAISGKI